MARLRLYPTALLAAMVLAGAAVAPATAQVGIQFNGGAGAKNRPQGGLFNSPRGAPIIIAPGGYREAEISDMRRCEQSYGHQAVEACTTAVLRDRDSAKAHRLLADALLATGRPGDALNEYNESLRLDSDNDEAKRGREMAQRYLASNQTPQGQPNTSAAALNPYGASQAPAPVPQPVAAPAAAGPRDGEWSGRMLRQCSGFSDEGPASVNVSGSQFVGVFFSSGGGRDLRGSIAPDGKVEASGKDTAGTPVEVKGRLLSPQTLMAEGYALNCKMVLLLGRGGAPVSAPTAMAAAAAPTPRTASGNPFDGDWSGALTGRAGHFPVEARVEGGKLVIKQERQGNRIAAQGAVENSGQATLSGMAGDAATRGDNMEIKGTFAGNMFIGQGRVGDKWAELKLTRTGAPPPAAATVVAQAPAAPPADAPAAQAPAPAQKPAEAPKAAEAPKPKAEPAKAEPPPAAPASAAPVAASKPAPAKTQTAAAPPPTTVAPSPAPMVDKQAPTIAVPAKLETDGPVVELTGKITDTSSIIEFSINGQPVPVGAGGSFTVRRGVPVGASELKLAAVDEWGNMAQKTIAVNRKAPQVVAAAPPIPAASPINDESPKTPEPVKVASVADQLKSIEFGTYRALVIGNNKYTKVRPLETAQNDAKVVADLLTKEYGFQVTVLTDATRQQIMEALYRMRAQLGEMDNLLVYYAGHGVRDDQTGRGYWLPVDADPDLPTNWIPTTDLTDVIKAMRARHIMVVADSCYSGTLTRSVTPGMSRGPQGDVTAWVKRIVEKKSRTVMSSGGLEPVMDGGGGTNHSVFAKAFIDALRENQDVLDGQGMFASIRRPIVLNSDQTPEYADIRQAGHDGGDFLFVKKAVR